MTERLTNIRRKAASLALVFFALFALLSLVSFSQSDLADTHWPPAESLRNVCGRLGALLADGLFSYLGYAAYFAVLLSMGFAIRCSIKKDRLDAWLSVLGGLVMLLSAAAGFQMIGPRTQHMPGSGGILGIAISTVLVKQAGTIGSWLVTLLFFALGGLLLSADELAEWAVKRGVGRVRGWITARRGTEPVVAKGGKEQKAAGFAPAIRMPRPLTALPAKPAPTVPAGTVTRPADAKPVDVKTAVATLAPVKAEPGAKPAEAAVAAETTVTASAGTETKAADEAEAADKDAAATKAPDAAKDEFERLPPIDTHMPVLTADNIDRIAVIPSAVAGKDYQLPPMSLLDPPEPFDPHALESMIRENSTVLERTLSEFGIGARVVGIEKGPSVTRYEIELAPGIKVNRITSLSDDLAMAVKAPSVRVVAPIPGKSTAGVEVPNTIKEVVRLSELIACEEFVSKRDKWILPILLGKDASGTPIITDLTRMPHLLIAGATGSGKSVCLNSIIVTTLMLHRPEDVRLILVDPKMVDLGMFEHVPHLLTPVVTDMKRAPFVLEWATKQMDNRYDLLARVGVRHITQYNKLGEAGIKQRVGDDFDEDEIPLNMPYIIIVVDELADMMMVASKEVEVSITRLAQKSRAVGVHIVLATQRPSVDVITGLIKSNLPTRVSFQVTSKVDSRTILDRNGAEKLLGSGDLLFVPPGTSDLVRVQGTYVSDKEIKSIVDFVRGQSEPAYLMNVRQMGRVAAGTDDPDSPPDEYGPDEMYDPACRIVLELRRGSVSLLQRKLEIGYTRAARLIDMMAVEGIVGGYKGSKAREVIMTLEEWEEKRGIPPDQRASARPAIQDDETAFSDDADDQPPPDDGNP